MGSKHFLVIFHFKHSNINVPDTCLVARVCSYTFSMVAHTGKMTVTISA